MTRDRTELERQLAAEEERLARLESERAAAQRQIERLRAELSTFSAVGTVPSTTNPPSPRTARDKLDLFGGLFRGRTDVFPTHWHNPRTNKKGYSPACSNEWVRGVCDKPRTKCGDCPNQAFVPVTDRVLLDHLQGRHIAGVYPLLEDETCWFLAADFDKGGWCEDVAAFVKTCDEHGLVAAVERSRSGNGAHVWFFFSQPITAAAARKLGCYLLTETMARRYELPMGSYDRLFPNQDTMPRGGFGNLIALPFQHAARAAGNTMFVDREWVPYADQWDYLAGLPRLAPVQVEELARKGMRRGRIIGVRMGEPTERDDAPWLRPPSRANREIGIEGPLPERVNAVLDQQLFVQTVGLPSALLNAIKRTAAFQNPEFYKKQAMRLSTALTPRVISCAEDLPRHVGIPRGCLPAVEELLGPHGVELVVEDRRLEGDPIDVAFHGELTAIQERAAAALLADNIGVFTAPPGTGKTVVGIEVIAKRARSTLVLVHRTQLVEQWRAQLSLFLDRKPKDIGQLGAGKKNLTGEIDVAMLQSLVRRDAVKDIVASYGHVVVDECHHVPAVSFERVMREVRARFITGLTATPQRRDGHHPILEFQLGPVRFDIDAKSQSARRAFAHELVVRETGFRLPEGMEAPGIQELYGLLVGDDARNETIVNDVVRALEDRRSPLLLTERREHLEYFEARLGKLARHLVVLRGSMGVRQRREAREALANIPSDEERLVLATGRFIGEGFDDARFDTLFLTLPVSWKGTLVQYAGRLHRAHQGKTEVRIFDYVDRQVPMLARMFEKRRKGYRAMGYQEVAAPVFKGAVGDDHTIEYDENVGLLDGDWD